MKVARTKRGNLMMPLATFQHPITDQYITFYGMVHIADRKFYNLVYSDAESHTYFGYEVHYELIRSDGPKPSKVSETYKAFADFLGLVFQGDAFNESKLPAWKNIDIHEDEISDEAKKVLSILDEKTFDDILNTTNRFDRWLFRKLIHFALRHAHLIPPGKAEKQLKADNAKREELAINAATETETDKILIWGSAHLPGMTKLLKKKGFELVHLSWMTAITKP